MNQRLQSDDPTQAKVGNATAKARESSSYLNAQQPDKIVVIRIIYDFIHFIEVRLCNRCHLALPAAPNLPGRKGQCLTARNVDMNGRWKKARRQRSLHLSYAMAMATCWRMATR